LYQLHSQIVHYYIVSFYLTFIFLSYFIESLKKKPVGELNYICLMDTTDFFAAVSQSVFKSKPGNSCRFFLRNNLKRDSSMRRKFLLRAFFYFLFNDIIVDNLAMQLVQKPQNLDVLVLPNLYGDIISDLAAGLIGGLGIAPGANLGDGMAVFEPVHGAAPKYAGKNMVNPTATILSAVLMLHYLGQKREAAILEKAVRRVIEEGKVVTYDLRQDRDKNKAAGTQEMAEEIAKKVREIREKD